MDSKVSGWIDLALNTVIAWGNKAFEFFGVYTSKYSKAIVVLVGLFILTKMFDFKAVLGGGGRK